MRVKTFSVMMSTNGNDDNHLFRNSKTMFFVWMVLLFGLLVTISPLIASEPGEILGPESGYMDLRWRSDDKVVAIQSEYEYFPDKLHYTHGEIVTVKYDIRVDTASRCYKPNRTYYLLSPYVTGYQIKGDGDDNYWFIVKSDIDTLEAITDDRTLKGEFILQLLSYKEKPKVIEDNEGSFISLTPIDTTYTKSSKHSGPPRFSIEVFRVAEINEGENVHLHSSGKFYYDQLSGFGIQGKVESEFWKNRFNYNSGVIAPKNDSFLPPHPSFRELATGGVFSTPIKVLKNSTLKWKINI
jgi:hypothetical protein